MNWRFLLAVAACLANPAWILAGDKPTLSFNTPEADAKIELPRGEQTVRIDVSGTHGIQPIPGQEFRLVLHDIYSNVYRQGGYVQLDSAGTWLHSNVRIGREISRIEVFCIDSAAAEVFDSWEFGAKTARQLHKLGGYQTLGSRNISVVVK